MTSERNFKVIQGGGKTSSPWLSPPKTTIGKSPFDSLGVNAYRISKDFAYKSALAGRRQPIFDLWGNVLGKAPPIPGIIRHADLESEASTGSFARAHACFRGVKRPVGEDDYGTDVVAFISKPILRYDAKPSMTCQANPIDVPEDVVFITHVKLDFPYGRAYQRSQNAPYFNGIITKWEFVETAKDDILLPIEYNKRFRKQLW